MDEIRSFTGNFAFLSNFYRVPILYEDSVWPSAEHAYQAAKTHDLEEKARIRSKCVTAGQAKKMGRKLTIRPDWEAVKKSVMFQVVHAKFSQYPDLMRSLIQTHPAQLIEENWWGDTFWGVYNGRGENNLGKILMKIRDGGRVEIRQK